MDYDSETLTSLISEKLAQGEDVTDLLTIAESLTQFNYEKALVEHGSDELLGKYIQKDLAEEGRGMSIAWAECAAIYSESHVNRVMRLMACDVNDFLVDYLDVEPHAPHLLSWLRKHCNLGWVEGLIMEYFKGDEFVDMYGKLEKFCHDDV